MGAERIFPREDKEKAFAPPPCAVSPAVCRRYRGTLSPVWAGQATRVEERSSAVARDDGLRRGRLRPCVARGSGGGGRLARGAVATGGAAAAAWQHHHGRAFGRSHGLLSNLQNIRLAVPLWCSRLLFLLAGT